MKSRFRHHSDPTPPKSTTNSHIFLPPPRAFLHLLRRYYWTVLALLILLALAALWSFAPTAHAQADDENQNDNTSQTDSTSDSDDSNQTADNENAAQDESTDTEEPAHNEEPADSEESPADVTVTDEPADGESAPDSGEPADTEVTPAPDQPATGVIITDEPADIDQMSDLEKRILELSDQLAEAQQSGAPPEELDRLMKEIQEAFKQQQLKLMAEPDPGRPTIPPPPGSRPLPNGPRTPVPARPVRPFPAPTAAPPTPPQPAPSTSPNVQIEAMPPQPPVPDLTEPPPALPVPAPTPEQPETPLIIQTPSIPTSPDDIVKLNMKNNILDLNVLIDTVGKELKFSFLYDNVTGVAGQVKLQQYGDIRRRDLLPLLESLLSFQKFAMVREDPFIRIVKRDESTKTTYPPLVVGPNTPPLGPGDQIVTQILAVEHVPVADVTKLLSQFTDPSTMVPIDHTNYLIITEYARRLPRLLEMVELIDQPGPPKILVPIKLQFVTVKEVEPQLTKLLESLAKEGIMESSDSQAPAPEPTPAPAPDPRTSRTTRTRTPSPSAPSAKAIPLGPIIHLDERTNRFLVIGTNPQIDQVRELLNLLDIEQPGPELQLIPYHMAHVLAEDVKPQIADLLDALAEQTDTSDSRSEETRRPPQPQPQPNQPNQPSTRPSAATDNDKRGKGPYMLVDDRTNRLLVVGTTDQHTQVTELLKLLDIERPGPPIKIHPIAVTYVFAGDVVTQLDDLIQALADQAPDTDSLYDRADRTDRERTERSPTSPQDTRTTRSRSRRDDFSSRRSRDDLRTTKSGPLGPYMLADERTNRILIVGNDEQIAQVKELLTLLDVPPYIYGQATIKVHQPQYVDAQEVSDILDKLGITESKELRPRDRARLDEDRRERPAAITSPTSPVGFGAPGAGEVQGLLSEEEFPIRIAIQESLNKMFVLATAFQHKEIEDLLAQIDQEPNEAVAPIQVYLLQNRDPCAVAPLLRDLLESDTTDVKTSTRIPGREGAPKILEVDDMYAVAVRGSKKQHEEIKSIISQLDKRLPQVLVEAILVQVTTSDSLDLGVSLQDARSIGGPRFLSGSSPFGIGAIQRTGNIVSGTGGVLAYLDDELVFATLEALQEQGDTKIVSKPRILVSDNKKGTIDSLREEPTTKTTFQTGSDIPIRDFDQYVEAGTTLDITPHITAGNSLRLEITLNVNNFEGEGTQDIPPPKSRNEITTDVLVPHGKTIVLGGLTTQTNSIEVSKIPLLGDIPIIGVAFRNTARSSTRALLYVFVKAHIVRSDTPDTENFEDLDNLSEGFRQRLKESEFDYKDQTIIPGIPDIEGKPIPSALDPD